jgi:hypothetical protein
MSWARTYRLALHLLPTRLRRKHGPAMEALFARELGRARARGPLDGALAGAAGVWDVLWRGAYEHAHGPRPAGANPGGPNVPKPTTRQLLRGHAASFAVAFVALTAALLAPYATRQLPSLSARGAPAGTLAEALLLAVPFVAAMTLPMAVLVAVLREFTWLRADGTLAAARREPGAVRRLVVPVLGAGAGVAALAFVVTAEVVPRANARLETVIAGRVGAPSDRSMTIAELRAATRTARAGAGPVARARKSAYQVAGYETEVQKKFALPAACVVLALVGVAVALRAPRGGAPLVIGASVAVFVAYYLLLVTGEGLAERLVVSPFVGMWGANALLLAAALLASVARRGGAEPADRGAVAAAG